MWDNEQAIINDLAEVSPGKMLVNISNAVVRDKPSKNAPLNEEMNNELLVHYAGTNDRPVDPDLLGIQKMLNLLKKPHANQKTVGQNVDTAASENDKIEDKEVGKMNMSPIYESSPQVLTNTMNCPLSQDFCEKRREDIMKTEINYDDNAVTSEKYNFEDREVAKIKRGPKETCKINESTQQLSDDIKNFVPTNYSKDLYLKYKKRTEGKVRATEDIWTKAERIIKEKEAKGNTQNSNQSNSKKKNKVKWTRIV